MSTFITYLGVMHHDYSHLKDFISLFIAMAKISEQSNLREERFILACGSNPLSLAPLILTPW
jgi:hypothetical protein